MNVFLYSPKGQAYTPVFTQRAGKKFVPSRPNHRDRSRLARQHRLRSRRKTLARHLSPPVVHAPHTSTPLCAGRAFFQSPSARAAANELSRGAAITQPEGVS